MAADTYLGITKWAEDQLGIKALTPEYEVTSVLFDAARITPLEMLQYFSGSNASFFKILKSLEAKDVVCAETNPSDRRSKFYRLSDNALTILSRQWSQYKLAGHEKIYASDNPKDAIHKYTKTITKTIKVKQFSCEYQILLYLNASPGITNISFHDLVDVSPAKFNTSLKLLKDSGNIYFESSPDDRRVKLYYISDRQRKLFEEMNKRMFYWLDSKSDFFESLQRKTLEELTGK